jgi:hypothetical protein
MGGDKTPFVTFEPLDLTAGGGVEVTILVNCPFSWSGCGGGWDMIDACVKRSDSMEICGDDAIADVDTVNSAIGAASDDAFWVKMYEGPGEGLCRIGRGFGLACETR